jgi:hypothetical protein|tara:strand:- start:1160 stop:1282 length:123 start_codon:yes stop_codon:yes gene_type:complete
MAEEKESKAKSKAKSKPKKVKDKYTRVGFVQAVKSNKKEK